MKKIFIIFIFCLGMCFGFVGKVAAANHYIRDGATGDGSDWTNALDDLPDTFVRGDTYYIADGNYDSHAFDTSINEDKYITIKKATNNDYGNGDNWQSEYGNGVATFAAPLTISSAHWYIDGQTRTSPNSGHGFKIINADCAQRNMEMNGTPDHITLRYIEFAGLGDDGNCQTGANDQLYVNISTADNNILEYCYFHDAGRTHLLIGEGSDNWLVQYNYFGTVESCDNCYNGGNEHGEPINVDLNSYWTIRYNIFNQGEGTLLIAVEDELGATGWEIYGNLFSNFQASMGIVGNDTGSTMYLSKFYNNTMVNGVGNTGITPKGGSGSGWEVYNNVWYNCENIDLSNVPHDYNASETNLSETHGQSINSDIFKNYANNDFSLAFATDIGISLGDLYNFDMLGQMRGEDGIWDRGAYEYTNGNSSIYRFWSNSKQGHFFTISEAEKNSIIANDHSWSYEGVAYNAFTTQEANTTPIYRFWSQSKQHHFFTKSESEKNNIIANDHSWSYEGIAYYAYATEQLNSTPVYRFWSQQKQGHFFTISEAEKNSIIANDHSWSYEGIAWYVPTN